ncbi:ABC transporter permease [Parasphingorhabdus sp.]|uniref:ABC transporter permease n=1 Tax=Parasphingorhabdus sp. TaxID=2709688 RepID=UPI003A8D00DA
MTVKAAFVATLREVFRQPEVTTLIVLAVVLYGFYYPAPYAHQQAQDVPIAVVDEESTALTRALVRRIDSSEQAAVIAQPADLAAAQDLLVSREAEAVLLIPKGMTKAALRGEGPQIALWIDGAYLVRAKSTGNAVEQALRQTLAMEAAPYVNNLKLPDPIVSIARFNPQTGYASYIFPAVTPVILQQTMLFGVTVLLALRRRKRAGARGLAFADHRELIGSWLAFTLLSTIASALYFGWFFVLQAVPGRTSPLMLGLIALLLGSAIAAFACAVGALFRRAETGLLLLIPSSLPIFFLTGATWPREAMPAWVAAIGAIFPATHGSRALLLADQMGAPFSAVAGPLALLVMLTIAYLALSSCLSVREKRRNRTNGSGPTDDRRL